MTAGRLLVTGATGQLGAAIVQAFSGREVVACSSRTLDIADPAAVALMIGDVRPSVVINCAAFNDVDGAEDDPGRALAVNAFAVRSLARACEATGAALVHYSTDFVFDGEASQPYDESARPSPRSHYGASKLLGEWFALDAGRALVLRVESLFGTPADWSGRRGSLEAIVAGLQGGQDVRVFADRVVTPGYVHDIAAATRHLLAVEAPGGVYHCVNRGADTWEAIAREAARMLDVEPRLQVVQTHEVTLRARRPRYCALAVDKLAATGFDMPHWRDALRRWAESRGWA